MLLKAIILDVIPISANRQSEKNKIISVFTVEIL